MLRMLPYIVALLGWSEENTHVDEDNKPACVFGTFHSVMSRRLRIM